MLRPRGLTYNKASAMVVMVIYLKRKFQPLVCSWKNNLDEIYRRTRSSLVGSVFPPGRI